MGQEPSPSTRFRLGIEKGDYAYAYDGAAECRRLGLGNALELTRLAAREDPQRYERMASHWLDRFEMENNPSLILRACLAFDFHSIDVRYPTPEQLRQKAERRLERVVDALKGVQHETRRRDLEAIYKPVAVELRDRMLAEMEAAVPKPRADYLPD